MGYGKSGMGGAHPIMKHMTKAGGGTGTSQSMSKNANIEYGGPVLGKESPMKNMYDGPLEYHKTDAKGNRIPHKLTKKGKQTLMDTNPNAVDLINKNAKKVKNYEKS